MSKPTAMKWSPADFRLHPGLTAPAPHWLLSHLYGRVLLASELRRMRPDLKCSRYDPDPPLLHELDAAIDRLGLRKWPRPSGCGEQIFTAMLLVRMVLALEENTTLPSWSDRLDRRKASAAY